MLDLTAQAVDRFQTLGQGFRGSGSWVGDEAQDGGLPKP